LDIEKFNKWSSQFEVMLNKLTAHEKAMQITRHQQIADESSIASCSAQVTLEKHLRKMANDIRALGFCYNNLKDSIHMQQEQFDTLD
jgi:hypothetical protein